MPGADEGRVAVVADELAGDADELVDIALVVGQQHEILEVLRQGAGVVLQTRERVVDALGREEREGPRLAGAMLQRAVGDGIVGGAEIGEREMILQRAQPFLADVDDALLDDEGERDAPVADADIDRNLVVLEDVADLGPVVAVEEVRPGDGGAVDARLEQNAVGEAGIDMEIGAADGDADIGIEGVDRLGRAFRGGGEGAADPRDAGVIKRRDAGEGRFGVVEGLKVRRASGKSRARIRLGRGELGSAFVLPLPE